MTAQAPSDEEIKRIRASKQLAQARVNALVANARQAQDPENEQFLSLKAREV